MRRCKGEKLLRDFNGKKLITFFLLMLLNLKEQRDGKKNDFAWYCKLFENGCVIVIHFNIEIDRK